ncbi:hypothetical protein LAZ67_4002022 [Cordylochernes scorpioides]|uniref:CCHC-type domain-containing protein n=1 Tax=Cordylochernes scorpioides TaxID=51811 RepID=A0ABY6KD88_9ARAC|nr:hypothetical protein LAZ67_4002022 [Cordylochernes scorpioides]
METQVRSETNLDRNVTSSLATSVVEQLAAALHDIVNLGARDIDLPGITVGNLPFFVADALSRYGRITSIAPKLLKAGEFTYTDGRREALLLLHDGITIDKLPTRFEIRIKGEAWPAFLSHGIKCSKCHGQGHRRANCPQLHGRSTTARWASPTSHLRPRCLGGLQLRLLRQRLPVQLPRLLASHLLPEMRS